MTDEFADSVGAEIASMWRIKGLPDRMDLARLMIAASEPWVAQSSSPHLMRDLVWELSGIAYRFTEAPVMLFQREVAE